MKPASRRLLQVLTVVVSAYYALWACAPAAAFRPMTTEIGEHEIGLGGSYVGAHSETPTTGGLSPFVGFNGQLWYQHRFTERFSFGGSLYAGQTSLIGAGLYARFHLLETDRWRLGADVEGGWLYGGVGMPVSFRLVDELWLYSNPSLAARYGQSARLPIGIAWGVTDAFWLQVEGGWGIDLLSTPIDVVDSGRWNAALAASFRF